MGYTAVQPPIPIASVRIAVPSTLRSFGVCAGGPAAGQPESCTRAGYRRIASSRRAKLDTQDRGTTGCKRIPARGATMAAPRQLHDSCSAQSGSARGEVRNHCTAARFCNAPPEPRVQAPCDCRIQHHGHPRHVARCIRRSPSEEWSCPFRGSVDILQLDVSVLDRDCRPMPYLLAATDFQVAIDGKADPLVLAFEAVNLPRCPGDYGALGAASSRLERHPRRTTQEPAASSSS